MIKHDQKRLQLAQRVKRAAYLQAGSNGLKRAQTGSNKLLIITVFSSKHTVFFDAMLFQTSVVSGSNGQTGSNKLLIAAF